AADRGMLAAFWAGENGEHPAIVSEAGDRTRAELNANANRLVRALRRRRVKPGDGIALMCSNRPEFAETIAAAQRAGLRLTTVNWHLTSDEAGYIVDDSEATAFVADARFAKVAREGADLAPRLRVTIAVGGDIEGFEQWGQVLAAEPGEDIDDPTPGATMLYTSGTTGRPKGVRRPPDPRGALGVARLTQYRGQRHMHLCTGPLYHAAPLSFSLTAPAAMGVPIVMMDGWAAEPTLALVEQHGVTHTHMVPTMFHRLLSLSDEVKTRYDLSSLVFIIHGAAPCPVDVKRRLIEWLGPIVWEYYAATEGAGTLVGPDEWLTKPGTVGRVSPPDHVRILDDSGAQAEPGQPGTVYLKAPDDDRFEYFKAPEKTDGAYRDTHFTLGDVGYVDADGYLFLTDRSAHLIISGGVNIYPAEVEAALLAHPAVGDVGVVGQPDDEWGEIVVAAVEPQAGVEPTDTLAAELVEWCRDRIAKYKCPRRVIFVEALPRHDNGKLYKHQLREQLRG
ncbi:MAG: long-chain acyl-CoA synthetase, partial [Actinomycetota bacterium]|nr:long-chain acyl-CoA synthetase [Actinomycetota bacterium]